MITVKVLIDSVEKVKKFSSIISQQGADCELIEGVHIMDAKSIMGIFSLDIKQPIRLDIHSDNREILDKLKEFIVEES
ncbi:HPr family phosphocarrier protein [Caproiciproducens sp. LBM24188]|jgi:PTS HPr component phosphorylation site.|nr:HPr family phosphocarrier protein [Oscillospiraceae bacterium]HHV31883.1 HPr family phosphocarrier protein [Clostridiales bacterium]